MSISVEKVLHAAIFLKRPHYDSSQLKNGHYTVHGRLTLQDDNKQGKKEW